MRTAAREPLAELRPGSLQGHRPTHVAGIRPPARALAYLGTALGGVGLYVPAWLTSRPETWPLIAGSWALGYGLAAGAIGVLALLGRTRLLLQLTMLGTVLLLGATALLGGAAWAYAVLIGLVLISFGLGSWALRWFVPAADRDLTVERIAVAVLLGFGAIALVTTVLGAAGWLQPSVTVATLLVLTIPLLRQVPSLRRDVQRLRNEARAGALHGTGERDDERMAAAVGMASLALCFAGALVWAIAPSVHFDALMYHLPIAETNAANGGFTELPYYAYWRLIGLAHTLYALAFVLGGQPLPSLLHFTFGLVTTALVWA